MIGDIITLGTTILDKIFPNKEEAEKAKIKLLELQTQGQLQTIEADLKAMQARSDVLKVEMSGNNVQRNWRPTLMYLFMLILLNNFIVYPYLKIFWPGAPHLAVPAQMWTLIEICVGGYIFGRTGEKISKTWKDPG